MKGYRCTLPQLMRYIFRAAFYSARTSSALEEFVDVNPATVSPLAVNPREAFPGAI